MRFALRALGLSVAAMVLPMVAHANILVDNGYVLATSPMAKTGAAFMRLTNTGPLPDRLLSVSSPLAKKAEIHETAESANGVMRMEPIPEGLELPVGEAVSLARGGYHIMLMGITGPFREGDTVPVTLNFERAGAFVLELPVDGAGAERTRAVIKAPK